MVGFPILSRSRTIEQKPEHLLLSRCKRNIKLHNIHCEWISQSITFSDKNLRLSIGCRAAKPLQTSNRDYPETWVCSWKFVTGKKPLPPHDVSETRKTIGIEIMLDEKRSHHRHWECSPLVFTPKKEEREKNWVGFDAHYLSWNSINIQSSPLKRIPSVCFYFVSHYRSLLFLL